MHKDREDEIASGAAKKPSAEDEFESRVRESEVRGFLLCSRAVHGRIMAFGEGPRST